MGFYGSFNNVEFGCNFKVCKPLGDQFGNFSFSGGQRCQALFEDIWFSFSCLEVGLKHELSDDFLSQPDTSCLDNMQGCFKALC